MTSKNKLLLTAMVMAAALVSGSMSVSASGGGVNSGQLTPRYANSQESATYRIFRSDQWNFINKYKQIFDSKNPDNPFVGKSYLDFTAEDFRKMPLEAEPIFVLALSKYGGENDGSEYGGQKTRDSIDSIRPRAMSREQFLHVLLREGKRRGILETVIPFLDDRTANFDTGSLGRPFGWDNRSVSIGRPLDVPITQRTTAKIRGKDAAYRDLATTLLQQPRDKIFLEEDVRTQLGYPPGSVVMYMGTDTGALFAGYIAGANPLFFNGRQGNGVAGPLPLTIGFDSRYSEQQIREAYCAVVPAITQLGRVEGIGQNVAVTAGFLMAREDARSSFAGVEVRLGAFGTLCPATSPVWNASKMGPVISGIDLLPQQATALISAPLPSTAASIPIAFHGTWSPNTVSCSKEYGVITIDENGLRSINDKDGTVTVSGSKIYKIRTVINDLDLTDVRRIQFIYDIVGNDILTESVRDRNSGLVTEIGKYKRC